VAQTVPQLRQFVADGGTIIAIGSSTVIGRHLGLPVLNHLVQDGKPLRGPGFTFPGRVLQVRVDNTRPVAWGMPDRVDVFFEESPASTWARRRRRRACGRSRGSIPTARCAAVGLGQQYLKDAVAVTEASVGDKGGKLFLFGPEILNRGQPHGTFKFFFNAIYLAGAGPGPGVPPARRRRRAVDVLAVVLPWQRLSRRPRSLRGGSAPPVARVRGRAGKPAPRGGHVVAVDRAARAAGAALTPPDRDTCCSSSPTSFARSASRAPAAPRSRTR